MYKQIVLTGYATAPKAWQNMIKSLYDKHEQLFTFNGVPSDIVNEELREFDAHYEIEKINDYLNKYKVEFQNERGYIMFLLKWG